MRGHWLSTTRRLNRHYQDGQNGGGPIDPWTPTYGRFACAAYPIPDYFAHNASGTGLNYYNAGYSYSPNTSSSYIDNMVRLIKYEGYKYDYLGGCFECGGKNSGIPEIDVNGLQYGGKNIGGYSPVADPGTSAFYDTALKPLDTGILFKDYGIKYAKLTVPNYNFGSPYYTTVQPQLPSTGTFFTENTNERISPQPVYNGIVLDADEITRLSSLRGNQIVQLTEEYINSNGQQASRVISFLQGTSSLWNLSNLKNNGVTYIDRAITLYRNGVQGTTINVTARLYFFLYDNAFYYSTKPDLYYDGELLEGYDNVYVSKHFFPSGVGGYPKREALINTFPNFYRWVDYAFGDDPASLESRYFSMRSNFGYLGAYNDGYLYFPHAITPFARLNSVSQREWNKALANAWT